MYICRAMRLEEAIKSKIFKDPVHKAAVNILYSAWWLKTIFNQYLKPFGLTHEQYNVLRILNGKHPAPMCVKDIGSRLIEKNSNVPRIIDRLVVKKWTTRSAGVADKRETLVQLTAAGISVLKAATDVLEGEMHKHLHLTAANGTQLNQLLEKMKGNG
jgi:DNA-binding MarR family transcriptional regulator